MYYNKNFLMGLNSTMVRLQHYGSITTIAVSRRLSQFHYGSITTANPDKEVWTAKNGSQFHYGSITTNLIWGIIEPLIALSQFHYGSITTPSPGMVGQLQF